MNNQRRKKGKVRNENNTKTKTQRIYFFNKRLVSLVVTCLNYRKRFSLEWRGIWIFNLAKNTNKIKYTHTHAYTHTHTHAVEHARFSNKTKQKYDKQPLISAQWAHLTFLSLGTRTATTTTTRV